MNKEPSISTHYKIINLTTNEKILVRVSAVNKAGSSAPTALEHPVLVREIVGKAFLNICYAYIAGGINAIRKV